MRQQVRPTESPVDAIEIVGVDSRGRHAGAIARTQGPPKLPPQIDPTADLGADGAPDAGRCLAGINAGTSRYRPEL